MRPQLTVRLIDHAGAEITADRPLRPTAFPAAAVALIAAALLARATGDRPCSSSAPGATQPSATSKATSPAA